MGQSIKYIIIDYGGVIIKLGKRQTKMPMILSKQLKITEDAAKILWYNNRHQLITGKESLESFGKKLHINSAERRIKFAEQIRKNYLPKKNQVNWDLLRYLKSLSAKYKIYGFSNTIAVTPNKLQLDLDHYFIKVFKSYAEGHVKPDRAAFLNILRKIKAQPSECVLIDDTDENIAMAEILGMEAIKYTALPALKKKLQLLKYPST